MRTGPQPAELLCAFERSGDGVYAVDWDQNIVFWNATAERLLGIKAADVLGRKCFDVIAGGDYTGHPFCGTDCPVIECARRGRAPENYDVRTRTSSGRPLWINVSIVVLRGKLPRSTLAVHLFRDITQNRRMSIRMRGELRALQPLDDPEASVGAETRLTRREAEVLQMLSAGLTTTRVAELLSVSPTTVRNHIEHLLPKLGVHNRLEAVVYAAQHGLA